MCHLVDNHHIDSIQGNKPMFSSNTLCQPTHQESTGNRTVLCCNVVLDKAPDGLIQRVANKVYEACRADQLKVVGFPAFGPLVQALQSCKPENQTTNYQVCVRKHDRLVVLQSLAAKWLETEYKDATVVELENHNQKYNVDGEYWHETAERPAQHLNINSMRDWVFVYIFPLRLVS